MSTIDPDQVHVSWHRDGGDKQVMIGLDGEDVKLALTFPVDMSKRELDAILAKRDREIDHYFEALARVRPNRSSRNGSSRQNGAQRNGSSKSNGSPRNESPSQNGSTPSGSPQHNGAGGQSQQHDSP